MNFLSQKFFHKTRYVLLVGALIAFALFYFRVSQLDQRFFGPSLRAFNGLILYLIEDYNGAAIQYRAHLKEIYQKERTASNPGWDALLRRELKEAEDLSKKEMEEDPTSIEPLLTLGEIALEEGNLNEATAIFEKITEIEKDQFDALLFLSVIKARKEDYGGAIDYLNQALRHYRIETRITAFLKAMETTGNLLELPKKQRPYSLLAHYFRYLRIFDPYQGVKAMRYAKKAIKVGDHADDAYLTLGILYEKKGKKNKALDAFNSSIKTNPKHSEAYRWAAVVYSDRGDLGNEYKMIKAAYNHTSEDPYYANRFIYFLTNKFGDYHQALSLTEKVLQQNPNDLEFLEKKAGFHSYLGDYKKSFNIYKNAININPNTPSLFIGMGNVLSNQGKTQEAVKAFNKAISLDPYNGEYHIYLATSYTEQGKNKEAIQELETGFSKGYFDVKIYSGLCLLYYETSDYQKAVPCMKKVLSIDPSSPNIKLLLPYAIRNLKKGDL